MGYVEPDQAAADVLDETIAPFLDDLKRRVDLRLRRGAWEVLQIAFFVNFQAGSRLLKPA
jgi:hypothetical protein